MASAASRAGGKASCSYTVPTGLPGRTCAQTPPARQSCAASHGGSRMFGTTIPSYSRRSQDIAARSQRSERQPVDASFDLDLARPALLLGGAWLATLLACHPALAEPASQAPSFHPVAADLQDMASNEEFWENLARYARFFTSVLIGTAYTALKPVGGLLRRPVTAVLVIAFFIGLYFFLNATLKGMLGVEVQEPLPQF